MNSDAPFRVCVDGRAYPAREASEERYEAYVVLVDGVEHGFDLLEEVLELPMVDERRGVTLDFGRFELALRRRDGRVVFQAAASAGGVRVTSRESGDEERALWDLAARLEDAQAPRACFFCRWSEVGPSSGWGHLGCMIAVADAYHERVTRGSAWEIKWASTLRRDWVDEWHSCARWELRPLGYGYRGRAGRLAEDER